MKLKAVLYTAGVLALALIARAATLNLNMVLVNDPALAYDNAYPINLQANGITTLSAQVSYGSATINDVPFSDGSQSSGSFFVGDPTGFSTAPATNNITVVSTSSLNNASVVLPGFVLLNGVNWATRSTTDLTAQSLANALRTVPFLSVSVVGSVVYTTTPAGSYYNTISLVSNNGNVVVASPFFTGGRDNATIGINGEILQQHVAWSSDGSPSDVATSIAAAINASPSLSRYIFAQTSTRTVLLTSNFNGAVYNYSLTSSTPGELVPSSPFMTAGTDADFTLNSTLFTASGGSKLTTALPVLYEQGSSPVIGGLTDQTTYYAIPVLGDSFMLATDAASAIAGNVNLVTITSTNTQPSPNSYTFAPLPISGTPSFKWQVSNDSTNWSDLQVASVTVSSYSNPPALFIWSFGSIGTRFVRLKVKAPTTGGLYINAQLFGTN